MRYLVTGAAGLVGRALVERLLAQGESVAALVRDPAAAADLRRHGAETFVGDLSGDVDLHRAVAGCDVVIHCAAVVRVAAPRPEVWAVNVHGTEQVLAACVAAGVGRLVYLSSVAVYGHSPVPMGEEAPLQPVAAYGESKLAAEQALWRTHEQTGMAAVVLRPCVIYGPWDRHAWKGIYRLCNLRAVPLPDGGSRLLDLVYVSDVVDAALLAAIHPRAVGRAYNLTDGCRHTYRDLLETYGQLTGRRPAIIPVPGDALVAAVRGGMHLFSRLGVQGDWAGQANRVTALNLDIHYSIERIREELGFSPQVDLAEGLRRTLEWQEAQDRATQQTGVYGGDAGERGAQAVHIAADERQPWQAGTSVARLSTPGKMSRFYDRRMHRDASQDYYGQSGFFNFGYWRADTQDQRQASENLVDELLGFIPDKRQAILDVACGMGATTRHLLRHYAPAQVTAVNISEEQLQTARRNAPGCLFLGMDASHLAFPDAAFDNLICVEAAFHFDTRARFLAEAHRVLRPGGYLVLSDIPFPKWAGRWLRHVSAANAVDDLAEYRAAYRQAGFDQVEIVDATRECWQGFRRSLSRWATGRFVRGEIPPGDYLRLMARLVGGTLGLRYYLLVAARKAA